MAGKLTGHDAPRCAQLQRQRAHLGVETGVFRAADVARSADLMKPPASSSDKKPAAHFCGRVLREVVHFK
jgi:hypothetical protein